MNPAQSIQRYAELPMKVESELGRCFMPVREVLALAPGSVFKLPLPAGSNVQVLVGGAPFATGEFVRMGGVPAVRLLDFGGKAG
jgi:flagellar motor switch protein FliN